MTYTRSMRLQRLLVGTGLVCVAAIAACTGEDAVLSNARGEDASAGNDATDGASADAGVSGGSVALQGDFEKAGCFGWTSNEATMALDPDKHGGSSACRVCASGSTSVWGIFQNLPSVLPGGYKGRGFVRASGDAGPPLVVLRVQAVENGLTVGPEHDGSASLLAGEPYAAVEAEIEIAAGQGVGIAILSQAPDGCFLVDDVTLTKR